MNWINLVLVLGGGTALAFVAYQSSSVLKSDQQQPGVIHDVLDVFGLGYLTRDNGGLLNGIDRQLSGFYRDVGSTVANIGDGFSSGYMSNFLDNPMVIPIGILLGTTIIGIVFFT